MCGYQQRRRAVLCSQRDAALTSLQRQSSAPLYGIGTTRHKRQRGQLATGVLQLYHPCLLLSSIPLSVAGDGNCLFRALSRGLYGSEDHHIHLRLRMTLEIATHREWYDIASPSYKGLLKDQVSVWSWGVSTMSGIQAIQRVSDNMEPVNIQQETTALFSVSAHH